MSLTLRFLGGLAHTLGDYALAQSRYAEALHVAQREGDLTTLAWLPHEMGRTAIAQKDYGAARKWLVVGIQALWQQGRKPGILYCLVEFSRLAAAEGQGLRALRLAGAAESLSERMGARVGQDARGLVRRQLEHAQCVVEEEDADAAWAEGREMPLQRAVTYAIEQATEP